MNLGCKVWGGGFEGLGKRGTRAREVGALPGFGVYAFRASGF